MMLDRLIHFIAFVALAAFTCAATSAPAAPEAGKEVRTASGIVVTTLREGSGASPRSSDTVKVNYRGVLENGQEFDSSYARGQPASFALNRVIPCWTEGLQQLRVGGKVRLRCPSSLAYGSRGVPGVIPPDATLVFEVELLEVAR